LKRIEFVVISVTLLIALFFISAFNVIATDGFVAYRSNTSVNALNSPKIRYWNNTANGGNGSWSSEIELASAGSPVRKVVLKESPVDSKIVMVSLSDDGFLDGYVCMKNCDNVSYWNLTSNIAQVWSTAANQTRYDIEFESYSGDLVLTYGVLNTSANCDIGYILLPDDNISFSGQQQYCLNDLNIATDVNYTWIEMDRDPINTSDELLMEGFNANSNRINAWIWNGTSFTHPINISTSATATTSREALTVKYSTDGKRAMAMGGNFTAGGINYAFWNGTTWSNVLAFDINGANGNDIQWLTLKADPTSGDMELVAVDSGSDLSTGYWNGTSATWTITSAFDATVDAITSRIADFAWFPTGGTGRVIWDTDTAGTTLSSRVCAPQCTAATQTFSTYAGTGAWLTLVTNPTLTDKSKFLGFRLNSVFDTGSFWYNGTGLNYTNYGDTSLTTSAAASIFEAYSFDFRRDTRQPGITFITPNASGILWPNSFVYLNITSDEYLFTATLEWNGTNYTMNMSDDENWYYNITGLGEGLYFYKVYSKDLSNNTNVTQTFNISIDFPPNISVVSPSNNTLNTTTRNITFYYTVNDTLDNVSSCSLIVDNSFVLNTTINPVNETITNNFTYLLSNNQHNWSIYCNDTNNFNGSSDVLNLTIKITPNIDSLSVFDAFSPAGLTILNAGSIRFVNCSVVASDPEGSSDIVNVSAKFYYSGNKSSESDDNNTHYTNSSCLLSNTTLINRTFNCGFNVQYYATNGTWYCNATVTNNYSDSFTLENSTSIQPLYAINVTDGIDFGQAASGTPSLNITANVTNFGNMIINMTVQGYTLVIGDNVGMNCTDGTNITITRIKFSPSPSSNYAQKTAMSGSTQQLSLQIKKPINSTSIVNSTYWQIDPDPGIVNRICTGFILFSGESP